MCAAAARLTILLAGGDGQHQRQAEVHHVLCVAAWLVCTAAWQRTLACCMFSTRGEVFCVRAHVTWCPRVI